MNKNNETAPVLYFATLNRTAPKNKLEKSIGEYADLLDHCLISSNAMSRIREGWQAIVENYEGRAQKPDYKVSEIQDRYWIGLSQSCSLVLTRVKKMI